MSALTATYDWMFLHMGGAYVVTLLVCETAEMIQLTKREEPQNTK